MEEGHHFLTDILTTGAILLGAALVAVLVFRKLGLGAVVGYFVYHAQDGNRGIETKLALKQDILRLGQELSGLRETLARHLNDLTALPLEQLLAERRKRLRGFGVFGGV